jgi:hypothetical protein
LSKGNTFEAELLALILENTNIADIGDATGLRGSSTAGSVYVSLHTADPTDAGLQTTSETSYTDYLRVAVARTSGSWTGTNPLSPAADIEFAECAGGTATITHFGIGTASSGGGKLLYSGTVLPNISVSTGVTPRLTTASTITED